jgi:hypothetical protein
MSQLKKHSIHSSVYVSFAVTVLGFLAVAGSARADQVINDDLIVTFSACIGNDCVNGESFGFDTLKLKENNLRIKAEDTSVSASFPSNDWQLTFNDSSNGGGNYFSVDDVTNGRVPFKVVAGAPTNAVYVDSAGDLGLGTSNPAVDLHVVSGNTPTLRLDQDGSSGFTAQIWDVAGNETNFFVRDVTHGSKLPLRIFPDANGDSLVLAAGTKVGIGIRTPDNTLHVRKGDAGNVTAGPSAPLVVESDTFCFM